MSNSFGDILNRLFSTGDFLMEKREPNKRTLVHKELGAIVFSKTGRNRNISITPCSSSEVRVTMPRYVSYAEADSFLLDKIDWIKEQQALLKEREQERHYFTAEEIARLRKQAHQFLPSRVQILADRYGFSYNKIFIKNIHSRWGSCSAQNNINFSIYLMHLPDDLVDYVILHELCHTVHRNHGPHFWALLNSCTNGNAKQLSARMAEYSTRIF